MIRERVVRARGERARAELVNGDTWRAASRIDEMKRRRKRET